MTLLLILDGKADLTSKDILTLSVATQQCRKKKLLLLKYHLRISQSCEGAKPTANSRSYSLKKFILY